jgi:hypothetical protein
LGVVRRHVPIFTIQASLDAKSLAAIQAMVTKAQGTIMSALTDLQASVTAIQSAVTAAVADIQALAASIGTQTDDPQVEAAATQISTLAANLQAAVSANPAPTPTPTPTPSA